MPCRRPSARRERPCRRSGRTPCAPRTSRPRSRRSPSGPSVAMAARSSRRSCSRTPAARRRRRGSEYQRARHPHRRSETIPRRSRGVVIASSLARKAPTKRGSPVSPATAIAEDRMADGPFAITLSTDAIASGMRRRAVRASLAYRQTGTARGRRSPCDVRPADPRGREP